MVKNARSQGEYLEGDLLHFNAAFGTKSRCEQSFHFSNTLGRIQKTVGEYARAFVKLWQ